ncbi:hypothetical protein H6771_01060 [Candidatus Peribacteria bacterium]|nr:hypothetical protein [Candidatus Peribacteria bacterium]
MKQLLGSVVLVLLGGIIGATVARLTLSPPLAEVTALPPTVPVLDFTAVEGDTLTIAVTGTARAVWTGTHLQEVTDGTLTVPLSQVPTTADLPLLRYPYTANADSGKYYESTTHYARSVAPENRRYYETALEAEADGYVKGGR